MSRISLSRIAWGTWILVNAGMLILTQTGWIVTSVLPRVMDSLFFTYAGACLLCVVLLMVDPRGKTRPTGRWITHPVLAMILLTLAMLILTPVYSQASYA